MDDADLSRQSKRTCNGSREPMPHTPHHSGPDRGSGPYFVMASAGGRFGELEGWRVYRVKVEDSW